MSKFQRRRELLAALGTGAVALAGCADLGSPSEPENGEENETTPDEETPDNDTEETPDNESEETPDDDQEADADHPAAIDHGELVDDFEDLELWGDLYGEVGADDDAVRGSQSLRSRTDEGEAAGAFKAFTDPVDLSEHDLSMAVRLNAPRPARISVELQAPYRSDHVASRRYVGETFDDWLRMDVGYIGRRGEPDLADVQEIRVWVEAPDGATEIDFQIDDMRRTPNADQGAVMLTFDDGFISQYENAFPMLQEREWPAVAGVIPDRIEDHPAFMDVGHLREMRDAGWDISSHPQVEDPLPSLPEEEQRGLIADAHEFLKLRGFPEGARHFFTPHNRMSPQTLEIVNEFHETSFTFGACPNALPPTTLHMNSRIDGTDPDGVRRLINLADRYNQLVVFYLHGVGDGRHDDITEDDFARILDHIERRDVEIITASDLLDRDWDG